MVQTFSHFSGIGYDIALALAKGGATKVYAVSRTLKDLEKLKDQVS